MRTCYFYFFSPFGKSASNRVTYCNACDDVFFCSASAAVVLQAHTETDSTPFYHWMSLQLTDAYSTLVRAWEASPQVTAVSA